MESLLIIVGSFLSLMLAINAFFLRGIFLDLNDVKVKMASIFENSKSNNRRVTALEESLKELENRLRDLELRLK